MNDDFQGRISQIARSSWGVTEASVHRALRPTHEALKANAPAFSVRSLTAKPGCWPSVAPPASMSVEQLSLGGTRAVYFGLDSPKDTPPYDGAGSGAAWRDNAGLAMKNGLLAELLEIHAEEDRGHEGPSKEHPEEH